MSCCRPDEPWFKDIAARSGKTFVQALLAAGPMGAVLGANLSTLHVIGIAIGAALLSVVWNLLLGVRRRP